MRHREGGGRGLHRFGRHGLHGSRHEDFGPEGWAGEDEAGETPHRHHHHRGGRRRVLDSTELRLVLLKLIGESPRHGYELIQAVGERAGGGYGPSPGVVYPALAMLEDMGLIERTGETGARKAFAITAAGEKDLADNKAVVDELFARLAALADMQARFDAAPVRRAMENLRNVLRATLGREAPGKSRVHDVAAILDTAAQQIERLP